MTPDANLAFAMAENDFPALFNAANNGAIEAKKKYLRLTMSDLALLVLGTLMLSIEIQGELRKVLAGLGSLCFMVSFIVTIMILKEQYEKIWYGARAIAETIKSLTWKYMTCSEPFVSEITSSDADELYISKLTKILSERGELFWLFNGDLGSRSEIPDSMRKTRSLDLEKRKEIYLRQRIDVQRKWYGQGAKQNKRSALRWFNGILAAQMLAVLSALSITFLPELPLNLAHLFSALAIAFLAWIQVKQHQELAQAYGLAAHELGLIAEQISHLDTDEGFSKFVCESENAISREHTMWVAKRERPI